MQDQEQNIFAGAFVDRSGELRKDPEWLDGALRNPEARFVPVVGDQCLIDDHERRAILLTREQLGAGAADDEMIFLGLFRNRPVFAVAIDEPQAATFRELGSFQDLRPLGTMLAPDEANLMAHARALVTWHASQIHCGRCGAVSRPEAGGNARLCTRAECGQMIFPRVDPAIIVLVSHGERCLLGRQSRWPEGLYSTIAGFAEPGESLEDAVRREVYEETNIRVGRVGYHSSQPWPFPSSLMIGFVAEALSTDIVLNDGELEDARWFTREELTGDGFPDLPFRVSISRRLVDHWITLGTR